MQSQYGPQIKGKKNILRDRPWFPTCPKHGHKYVKAKKGFIYCAGIGWHPTEEDWDD